MNNVNELDSQMCNESAAGFPPDLLTNNSINIKTQVRLVTLIVLAVFFGEVLVMFILPLLPSIPIWGQAFVDAGLLILFVSPALYFGLFRSLIQQLEERQKISRELGKHRNHLEELVAERTTDLSVANEMLTKSEERFRSVVETALEGIIVVDNMGRIQFWNDGAEKMFGYSAEEVNGRKLDFLIPKRFRQAHNYSLKQVAATGESKISGQTLSMAGIRKGGTEFPLELSLAVWKANQEVYFTAVIRDVTDRKLAEEALNRLNLELEERVKIRTSELRQEIAERKNAEEEIQKNKTMLQAVFDGISDPLILVDKEMRIKMMNKMAVEYYNISDYKDSIGKKCHQAAGKSHLCRDCQIPALALKGQYKSFERQSFINPDSIEQVVVYPVKERTGDTGDAIIRISDITEAKRFERRLIESEKMASLGVLVSSIAHEINNPNNFVSFNIPILREYTTEIIPYLDKYAAEQPDFELCNMPYAEFRQDIFKLMNNIENGAHRISSFVANLRQYSQGGSIKAFSWLDLAVLIDKVLDIVQTEINKSVKIFKKSISVNLPEIYSDGLAIEQILINLIMNAAQAVAGGNSRVELNVAPRDDLREGVVIEVSDNGCGMDDDTRLKIFNPFFTTKSAGGGTGLGLYVCHNLIQGLGGQIEVESTPGKGSTFRVILPCGEAGKG